MSENLALQRVDGIPHDLPSLSLERAVQDLEHGLLIYIILVIDLLKEAALRLPLSMCQLFGINRGKLIDLLIHFLEVEIVLGGVRA